MNINIMRFQWVVFITYKIATINLRKKGGFALFYYKKTPQKVGLKFNRRDSIKTDIVTLKQYPSPGHH